MENDAIQIKCLGPRVDEGRQTSIHFRASVFWSSKSWMVCFWSIWASVNALFFLSVSDQERKSFPVKILPESEVESSILSGFLQHDFFFWYYHQKFIICWQVDVENVKLLRHHGVKVCKQYHNDLLLMSQQQVCLEPLCVLNFGIVFFWFVKETKLLVELKYWSSGIKCLWKRLCNHSFEKRIILLGKEWRRSGHFDCGKR